MNDKYYKLFPFTLSDFQKHSIDTIVSDNHNLVTAPTGSGKSLSAEFAIRYFTEQSKTVIYASPIKALSNQKYYDFSNKFPDKTIGILTGDIKSNPDADIIIMTTEILHNKLQETASDTFDNVACIIFDEIHYINDADRGRIWEESIIMICKLASRPLLVMLSATLATPQTFVNWMETLCDRKVLISDTSKRVVPLNHYSYLASISLNKIRDKDKRRYIESGLGNLELIQGPDNKFEVSIINKHINILKQLDENKINVSESHTIKQVCINLQKNNMLPGIVFVFSRKRVELLARSLDYSFQDGKNIKKECDSILRKLPNYKEYMNLPEYKALTKLLIKGIGIHHSGMLPIFREVVEIMFSRNKVQVLFATETFAAGINLPVKTAIFTQIKKYTNNGTRYLYPHEYTQMAGRAGRRGIDEVGNVVHLLNLYGYSKKLNITIKKVLSNVPQKLISKLKVSYSLFLNNISECDGLVSIIKKSMYGSELDSTLRILNNDVVFINDELKSLNLEKILEYEELLKIYKDDACKKKKKVIIASIKLLEENSTIKTFIKLKKDLETTKNKISYYSNLVSNQVYAIREILITNEFINKNLELLPAGVVASQIKKVNALVLTTLILNNYFDEMPLKYIVAVLSCFCSYRSNDVPVELPGDFPDLKLIEEINDFYYILEKKNLLDSGIDYELEFSIIPHVIEWCEATDIKTCNMVLHKLHVSTGDFVKILLNINAISEELYNACNKIGKIKLCHSFQQIPDLILKYIASPNSLYV